MRYLLLLIIVFCGCVGNREHQAHRDNFHRYYDSLTKYYEIKTECGYARWEYYDSLFRKEYALYYPNGNPCCGNDKKITDTICYPMKP